METTRKAGTATRVTSRPIAPGQSSRRTGIVLIASLFASCAAVRDRNPVPEELVEVAAVPGIPRARFFGDTSPAWLDEEVREIEERRASDPALRDKEYSGCYLAISGGGSNGAFGAGLLNGWSEAGTRPSFDLVTGISTGALIAPFAFEVNRRGIEEHQFEFAEQIATAVEESFFEGIFAAAGRKRRGMFLLILG